MQIIISPTKQMTESPKEKLEIMTTTPVFLERAIEINKKLAGLSEEELSSLMKTSAKITKETWEGIKIFETKGTKRIPAILAYTGTVFKEAGVSDFDREDFDFAKKHLLILSAKYGILRAGDEICPYRLEAKTSLKINDKNLYQYWSDTISDYLISTCETIINLASDEYSKMISSKLSDKLINIHFKVKKGDQLKTVGYYSKLARGKMLRSIIREKLNEPLSIQSISPHGYLFSQKNSSERDWIFIKEETGS